MLASALAVGGLALAKDPIAALRALEIVVRIQSGNEPPFYMATYSRPSGDELIAPGWLSNNDGRSWTLLKSTPDFAAGLPLGFRRSRFPSVLDPRSGRIVNVYNALDTPGLDPGIAEPKFALKSYYLRYRVSTDAGRTWLFDEPVIQNGHTEQNPLEGVWKGKNGVFFGDVGCVPIFTRRGALASTSLSHFSRTTAVAPADGADRR
jgi:hypothetical protein